MNDKDFYENDRDSIRYEGRRVHHEESFFERNCDEAWEQICETFSHPGRLFAKVLLIALLCGVVAGGSYLLKIRAPELPSKGGDSKNNNTEQTDGIDYGDGVRPKASGERKSKDFYTVLVLGRDTGGGGNTDTMLLASYDVTNQKATVMSIPRDTMVNVPWDVKRINSVYNYYGGGEKGIKALYKEISQLVGFEPDYQVIVEWDAVGAIVEAMGGVYYDVPRNMNYDDPYQDLHIHFNKGMQHLSGEDAVKVLRWRKNNSGENLSVGDVGRVSVQHSFLQALAQEMLSLGTITKIGDIVDIMNRNLESNLNYGEMIWFGEQFLLAGDTEIRFHNLPGDYTGTLWSQTYQNYQSYVFVNSSALLELVNTYLNPYQAEITSDMQHVIYDTTVNNLPVEGTTEESSAETQSGGTTE